MILQLTTQILKSVCLPDYINVHSRFITNKFNLPSNKCYRFRICYSLVFKQVQMRSNSKGIRTTGSSSKISSQSNKPLPAQKKIEVKPTTKSSSRQKPSIASLKNVPPSQPTKSKPVPTNLPRPSRRIEEKTKNNVMPRYMKKKEEPMKQCKWGYIGFSDLLRICRYACSSIIEVYQLSKVCSLWRGHMQSEGGCHFWNYIKAGENIKNFHELKLGLQGLIVANQEKMSFEYEQLFTKLFNYGSTKQNIPNKLIEKLSLEMEITLNNGFPFMQPFKLRTFNFSSYLCAKIEKINDFKYDFYTPHNMFKDKIDIKMNFRSKRFKVQHRIEKKYVPEDIVDGAIKQKAFNYFLDKNFVFTYFEGDTSYLYIFFEISVLELVNIFRSIIKSKHKQSLSQKSKKLPMYKVLAETQFQNFQQYIKFQADFQIHFSYHNSLKQIFTHCDTKVFPVEYTDKYAYFEIKVDDSFDKVATYKLDNKMGMSEPIEDLYLLDFVLKDRDRFLIIFSGFMCARKATQKERESVQNYFEFAENPMKILQSKQDKYHIAFLIIEQNKRNLMKNVKLTYFA